MKYIQGIITGASLMLCFFLMVGAKQSSKLEFLMVDKLHVNESISVGKNSDLFITEKSLSFYDQIENNQITSLMSATTFGYMFNKKQAGLFGIHPIDGDASIKFDDIRHKAHISMGISLGTPLISSGDKYGKLAFQITQQDGFYRR